ncbi:MAG: YihY family inner membrane protein [Bacilli bacterium]|nr:YihY family inner membrane protein [Bacilli bacterium]
MNKLKKFFIRILKLVQLDEMVFLPAHLAFYLIFLIIPIISFIGIITNKINISDNTFLLNNNIPNDISNLILNANKINYNNFNMILFLIISLYIASQGSNAIIVSSNILFKIKENNSIKIRIKSIFLTVVLFILITFMVMVPVLGDLIVNFITNYLRENGEILVLNIYNLLKYPLSIILIFMLIKIIYILAPTIDIPSKYMNNGAIFTTIMWLIISRVYSMYLNNFNNYNLYYGSFSIILILLIWVYLLSYIFVIGMALNADNYLVSTKND